MGSFKSASLLEDSEGFIALLWQNRAFWRMSVVNPPVVTLEIPLELLGRGSPSHWPLQSLSPITLTRATKQGSSTPTHKNPSL